MEQVTAAEYEQYVRTDRRRRGRLDIANYMEARKPNFINSLIMYYGRDKAPLTDIVELVSQQVLEFIHLDLLPLLATSTKFKANAISCGSASEGVKVRIPNEFDWIFEVFQESLNPDNVFLDQIHPETFRPRNCHSEVYERSFFRITFQRGTPDYSRWSDLMKCKECMSVEECKEIHQGIRYLCPRAVQCALASAVDKSLSLVATNSRTERHESCSPVEMGSVFNANPLQPCMIRRNGPAVSCYTKSQLLEHPGLVKIDLTFGIPICRTNSQAWPLDYFKDIRLGEHVLADCGTMEKCHLIPAGDYWKVSFVPYEKERMIDLLQEDNKKYCFQAIKCLRDELSLTDDYESALLSSYPMKVSFLKEQLVHPGEWSNDSLGDRAVGILGRIENHGSNDILTSYYIDHDPMFPGGSDRSHVETRRMLYHIFKQTTRYRQHATVHALLWILFTVWQLLLGIASHWFTINTAWNQNVNTMTNITISEDILVLFPSVHLAFSFLAFATPFIGLTWIRSYHTTTIYQMYCSPTVIYSIMFLFGLLQLVISICLSVIKQILFKEDGRFRGDFIIFDDKTHLDVDLIWIRRFLGCCWTSMAVGGLALLMICWHCGMISMFGKDRCRLFTEQGHSSRVCFFHCEIVFCDDIYKQMCGCRPNRSQRRYIQI